MASSSSRQPTYSWQSWQSWGAQPGPQWGDLEDDAAVNYNEVPADVAGEELFALLVRLKLSGTLSAKQACLIGFWAHKAGAAGDVRLIAERPDAQSGKFSR
eukprot:15462198-Alexandrium_andersonii.AAC.1